MINSNNIKEKNMVFEIIPEGKFEFISKTIDSSKLNERMGIIIMLDALGAQTMSIDQSKKFIENFFYIINNTNHTDPILRKIYGIKENEVRLKYFIFQDTIIISVDINDENDLMSILRYVVSFISYFFVDALIHNLYFRGAISYGKFVEYNNSIYLGDAVNEAAAWYEEANWLGIVFTPNLGKFLYYELKQIQQGIIKYNSIVDISVFDTIYTLYNTPLKNNRKCVLWTVNWAFCLAFSSGKPELNIDKSANLLTFYYALMKYANIPKGTEDKYTNTHLFVEFVCNKFPQLKAIVRPEPLEKSKL